MKPFTCIFSISFIILILFVFLFILNPVTSISNYMALNNFHKSFVILFFIFLI